MSEFVIDVETDLPPAVAWERLWDLDRHTATIPLTRVTVDAPATQLGEGVGFTGRTALGPLGFDDTMRVEVWRPPGPQPTAPQATAPWWRENPLASSSAATTATTPVIGQASAP